MKRDQRGITSLMVTMLMIVITSLIVLAFAQVARREQRTALDNQLSSQAYYAAESGINAAKQVITAALASPSGTVPDIYNDCNNDITTGPGNTSDLGNGVRYSCVTIDPTPTQLTGTLSSQQATVVRVRSNTPFGTPPYDPNVPGGIKITWTRSTQAKQLSDCPTSNVDQFSAFTDWKCPFGVLRFEMTDMNIASFNAQTLSDRTETGFFVPTKSNTGPVSIAYGYNHGNRVMATTCSSTSCTAVIGALFGKDYYLSLRLLYGSSSQLTIERTDGTGVFVDSQATIDVTGKAQDVLRRLKVAVNITGNSDALGTALMAGDGPCKLQFLGQKNDGSFDYSDDCTDDSPTIIATEPDPDGPSGSGAGGGGGNGCGVGGGNGRLGANGFIGPNC